MKNKSFLQTGQDETVNFSKLVEFLELLEKTHKQFRNFSLDQKTRLAQILYEKVSYGDVRIKKHNRGIKGIEVYLNFR